MANDFSAERARIVVSRPPTPGGRRRRVTRKVLVSAASGIKLGGGYFPRYTER